MEKEFNLSEGLKPEDVRCEIRECQHRNHIQQVAFSTYHNTLTQICFTCKKIRTEMRTAGEKLI